jgi:flagellar protein FlaI
MEIVDKYNFVSDSVPVEVKVVKKQGEFVPIYQASILHIEKSTEAILDKIRDELVEKVQLDLADVGDIKKKDAIRQSFESATRELLKKYFPDIDNKVMNFFVSYMIQRSLGLGDIDLLKNDGMLEEIVVNCSTEPVWVYHKKHGWLKTNIILPTEEHIKHVSTTIGRDVGRQINLLEPLMDSSLVTGERVNATLMPISSKGNTITIRKFAEKPWTVTDFINSKTISVGGAAMVWLGVQYELSCLIAGGTGSGKTSMLNVLSNFFPPNQRIISIEDTREVSLPSTLHWVPMCTRLPNPEGKGEITMLDLVVNSLRMRPDRILVGEIRRQREAEVLFEAIHTGHSVYATIHANDAHETVTRLTNPPIDVPKSMLPALSMIVVQHRNRRTGARRTFQVAEVLPNGEPNVLKQLDLKSDKLLEKNKSKSMLETLELHVGFSQQEMLQDLKDKENMIKWMVKHNVTDLHEIGRIIAEYYQHKKKGD